MKLRVHNMSGKSKHTPLPSSMGKTIVKGRQKCHMVEEKLASIHENPYSYVVLQQR